MLGGSGARFGLGNLFSDTRGFGAISSQYWRLTPGAATRNGVDLTHLWFRNKQTWDWVKRLGLNGAAFNLIEYSARLNRWANGILWREWLAVRGPVLGFLANAFRQGWRLGLSFGDPHIRTPDGLDFDFQAAGEFIAVASTRDDLVIQVRYEPSSGASTVSNTTAVAMNVAGDRVGIYLGQTPPLRLNGQPVALRDPSLPLGNGGRVLRDGSRYLVVWPDGSAVLVDVRRSFLNLTTSWATCPRRCATDGSTVILATAGASLRSNPSSTTIPVRPPPPLHGSTSRPR
jgi:hypothetical protein